MTEWRSDRKKHTWSNIRRGREWNLLNKRARIRNVDLASDEVYNAFMLSNFQPPPTGEGVRDNVGDLFAGTAL